MIVQSVVLFIATLAWLLELREVRDLPTPSTLSDLWNYYVKGLVAGLIGVLSAHLVARLVHMLGGLTSSYRAVFAPVFSSFLIAAGVSSIISNQAREVGLWFCALAVIFIAVFRSAWVSRCMPLLLKGGACEEAGDRDLRRGDCLAALAVVATVILFFHPVFTSGKTISAAGYLYVWQFFAQSGIPDQHDYNGVASDVIDSLVPYYYWVRHELVHAAHFPLSNDLQLSADNNATLLSAYLWSVDGFFCLIFGVPWGLTVATCLRFALGGLSCYAFLRMFLVRRELCLLAAITFNYCVFSVVNVMFSFVFALPVLLLTTERVLRRPTIANGAALATAYAFSLASVNFIWGVHQILFQILYAAVRLLSIWRFSDLRRLLRVGGICVAAGVLSMALFSFLILPTNEHYAFMNLEYRERNSFNYHSLLPAIMWFFPEMAGSILAPFQWGGNVVEYSHYVGLVPILLFFAFGLFAISSVPGAFFVLMSVAIYFVITNTAQALDLVRGLPFFNSSSNTRLRFLLCASIPMSVAFGVDAYISRFNRNAFLRFFPLVVLCFVPIGLYIALPLYNFDQFKLDLSNKQIAGHLVFQLISLLICSSLVISLIFAKNKAFSLLLLCLATFADLYISHSGYIKYINREDNFPRTKIVRFLQDKLKGGRILPIERTLISNFAMPYDISSIQPRGFFTERQKRFFRLVDPGAFAAHPTMYFYSRDGTDYNSAAIDLLNVRLMLIQTDMIDSSLEQRVNEKWSLIYRDSISVYKNSDYADGNIVRAVPATLLVRGDDNILDALKKIDIEKELVVEDPLAMLPAHNSERRCEPSKIKALEVNSDHYEVMVESSCETALMLSRFFHPAWKAYINDSPAKTFPANYVFVGLIAPKGVSKVTFRYEPRNFSMGVGVSIASFLILVSGLVWSLSRVKSKGNLGE